ncbi:ABC transporter substrate-binding protein [Castellaniella caeni]|uniref:ABC transporter substrate-binding protein n=1 Tax=Castellaniella caeni TaxID=266123 RepID=UPI00215575F4|nr:ABC transporter substrate-binding protein [Castellaniella caeni]
MISRRAMISFPWVWAATASVPRSARARSQYQAVTIGLSLRPDSLDPTRAPAAAIGEVVHCNIFEGLTKVLEDSQVVPCLASHWDISDDRLRYRFSVRPGVLFHDGSRLDAAVVASSLLRAQALGTANKLVETWQNMATVRALDAQTVEITLRHADPFLTFRLGEPPAAILHPETAGQAVHHPIGTGPYRFVRRGADGEVELVRWSEFRDTNAAAIPAASFHFISNPAEQIRAIHAGELDALFAAASGSLDGVMNLSDYEVLLGSSSGKGLVAINHRRPPLNDARVRRALTMAIDREAFIREVQHRYGVAIGSHFAPSESDFLNLTAVNPYDPAQARSLLREAGVRAPLTLDLALPPTPYALRGGPVVVRYLRAVGVQARLVPMSWEAWMAQVFRGHFDLSLILHVEPLDYAIYARPDYYFGYDSAEFRALVVNHAISGNPREQHRLFRQIQRKLADDAASAWIFTPQIGSVTRKGLKGVPMNLPLFTHDVGAMYWV